MGTCLTVVTGSSPNDLTVRASGQYCGGNGLFLVEKKNARDLLATMGGVYICSALYKLIYVVVGENGRARFDSDYVMDLDPKDIDACYLDGSLALVYPETFGVGHNMNSSAKSKPVVKCNAEFHFMYSDGKPKFGIYATEDMTLPKS